jgi:hypothetical protein
MKDAVLVVLAAGLLLGSEPAHAEIWQPYEDDSRLCRLEYPSSLFQRESIDDDDFLNFSTREGEASFRVKSIYNKENLTPEEIKAEFVRKTNSILIYDRENENFLVLSGFHGDNIFYSKIALSEDRKQLCILHISYSSAMKRAFNDIVPRMSRSFRAKGHRITLFEAG